MNASQAIAYSAGGGYTLNGTGRLAAVRIGYATLAAGGGLMDYLEEMYTYSAAGAVTGKKLRWNHSGTQQEYGLSFTYGSEGQVLNSDGAIPL